MRQLAGIVPIEARGMLGTISKTALIVEIIVGVIVIALLIAALVLSARKRRSNPEHGQPAQAAQADPGDPPEGADGPDDAGPALAEVGPLGQPDPFTGFVAASPSSAGTSASAAANAPSHSRSTSEGRVPSTSSSLVPAAAGTPPGWLPDPGGTPDTLRYWDGTAWTQHLARPS